MKKLAILQLSTEVLAQLLQLPAKARILQVSTPPDKFRTVEVLIEGAGWPVEECSTIKRTIGDCSLDQNSNRAVLRINWRLGQ